MFRGVTLTCAADTSAANTNVLQSDPATRRTSSAVSLADRPKPENVSKFSSVTYSDCADTPVTAATTTSNSLWNHALAWKP